MKTNFSKSGRGQIVAGFLTIMMLAGQQIPIFAQANNALYIDPNGNVGVGKAPANAKLDVDGNIKATSIDIPGFSANALVPTGAILMWSGAVNTIPAGWALCDGSNGRPDLRSRFIVGYDTRVVDPGGNYWNIDYNTIGSIGGQNEVTLDLANMPQHNHNAIASTAGSHTHANTHSKGGCWCAGSGSVPSSGSGTDSSLTFMNAAGDHTHTITVGDAGNGRAFDARPPFFTLAFIIKTP